MKPITCLHCGKQLRVYRYRDAEFAKDFEEWGGYGDNLFCGKTCCYRWTTTVLGLYQWRDARVDAVTFRDAFIAAGERFRAGRSVKSQRGNDKNERTQNQAQ